MTGVQITADALAGELPEVLSGSAVVALVPATELRGWAAEMAWRVATAAAAGGRRTALVDCFVNAPTLHTVAGAPNEEGLVDAFEYGVSLNRIVQQQPDANLFFIPTGTFAADAQPLMANPRWKRLSAGFRHEEALLLLYVDADNLRGLAAEPDGIVVLAPQGLDTAASVAPALLEAIGEGLPLLAVVAEPVDAASPADVAAPAPTDETHSEGAAPAGDADAPGPAPLSRLIREPRPTPWGTIAAAAVILGGLGAAWAFRDRIISLVGGPPTVVEPAAPTAPAPVEQVTRRADSLPFAIQVAAFTSMEDALAVADSLERGGAPTMVSPVRLGARSFHRVFVGPFASESAADSALRALSEQALLARRSGITASVPLSLLLASGLTREGAAAQRARLRSAGVPSFTLGQADGSFRLFAGAYDSSAPAALLQDLLTPTGNAGTLVPRVGYVP